MRIPEARAFFKKKKRQGNSKRAHSMEKLLRGPLACSRVSEGEIRRKEGWESSDDSQETDHARYIGPCI